MSATLEKLQNVRERIDNVRTNASKNMDQWTSIRLIEAREILDEVLADLAQDSLENLRLDGQEQDLRPRDQLDIVGGRVDAVAVAELLHALLARPGDADQLRGHGASGQQPANERLGQVASAQEANGFVDGHDRPT